MIPDAVPDAVPDAEPDTVLDAVFDMADHRPRGTFISFEGGDGVGKSTQLRLLAQWLTAGGHRVVTTREPGGTPLGVELRRAVMHGDHVAPRAEALIYAADRAHHVATVVRPALAAGAVVLTDRYLDSSVAYQGSGRDLGADEVERLSLWAVEGLLPDLTVLLDLDPAVGLTRLTGDPDRLERAGVDFHARTRRAFLDRAAADPDRWLVLDATEPVDALAGHVRTRVARLLVPTEPLDRAVPTEPLDRAVPPEPLDRAVPPEPLDRAVPPVLSEPPGGATG